MTTDGEKKGKDRAQLEEERERLLLEIEEASKLQNFGDDVDSMDEETDEGEDLANRLAMVQALKDRVNEIENTLRQMDAGQ